MAVLSYVPVANGTVTVTSNGEPVQTEGTISETLSGEVNIEVKKTDGDEDLDALTIAENGIMGVDGGAVSITLSSKGAVTMQVGSEIGGTAAISITDGANFTAVDDDYHEWVYIGHSKQVGEATLQPKPGDDVPPQFSVTIDGPGSVMNLQGKSGVASPGHPGEGSGTPAGWIVLGYYEGTNWQKTEINITNGGALAMSGRAAIGSATEGLDNTCTSAITTINISGKESKLTMDRGDIGSIRIAQGDPKVSIETYITVEDGGVLECKKGYIGYVGVTSGAGSEAYASSKTVIEIKDDSKFTIEGGYLGNRDGSKSKTITNVTVSGNGVLKLNGGSIFGHVNSTITLEGNARFEIASLRVCLR